MAATGLSERQRRERRVSSLMQERSSWIGHWRELSEYQQPRLGRFFPTDVNRGNRRHNSIYDRTALGALRVLESGMMSGTTSPARPWFRLKLHDRDLMKYGPVKVWLHKVGELLKDVFAQSNTYQALQQCYGELGLFGTWADVIQPDYDTVLRHYPLTIGEYALGTNDKQIVDTMAREYQMTVGQMVKMFGADSCSQSVRNLYHRGQVDAWWKVVHLIEPNENLDTGKMDRTGMPFSSTYFEPDNKEHQFLRESGYENFPVLAPRWAITGNDIYGNSPGMEAQGDVKQLQHQQLRKSQGIDYMVNPPLQVPTEYKDAAENRLPGGVMYVSSAHTGGGVRSAYEVRLDLNHLLADIQDVRERIRSAYYADLFLMLANDTRSGTTATEIAERHEEKLLMLGPVLERLHNELLSPLIDAAFDRCAKAGILPPIPLELEGVELNIEFISTLAQAQRVVSAQSTDRLLGTVGSMAALWPEVRAKIKAFAVVDSYADAYGVPPENVADDEEANATLMAQAKAQAMQQMASSVPAAADAAKTASEINPQGLRDVMAMFQGYGSPSAQDVQP